MDIGAEVKHFETESAGVGRLFALLEFFVFLPLNVRVPDLFLVAKCIVPG